MYVCILVLIIMEIKLHPCDVTLYSCVQTLIYVSGKMSESVLHNKHVL
jgi:hypothetical protein